MSGDARPWRLIRGAGGGLDPVDGPTNMAIDSALLEAVMAGAAPVLRLYRWAPPTLSFGRNQPARDRYAMDVARKLGIAFVRRPTGGQAVLHDDELTYAVIAPIDRVGRPRAAYALVNRAIVAGLAFLGLEAGIARPGEAEGHGNGAGAGEGPLNARNGSEHPGGAAPDGPNWGAACFRRPAGGEVVIGGAKLVGSAQRVEGRTILQHGSILMGGSQTPVEALLRGSGRAGPRARARGSAVRRVATAGDRMGDKGWTTLERELGRRPGPDALGAAVGAGFQEVMGVALRPDSLTGRESNAAARLRRHFESEDWTWRR
jgi:lipoate-protein ligase A